MMKKSTYTSGGEGAGKRERGYKYRQSRENASFKFKGVGPIKEQFYFAIQLLIQ